MEFEDHFSETQKEDSGEDEEVSPKENKTAPPVDRFTELMFGSRASDGNQENNRNPQLNNEEVDYGTLMEQIDDIMVSLENLKPMLQHFSPIVDYIKKKI